MYYKKINVHIVHAFDAFGGAQRIAATLIKALNDVGLNVRLFLGFGTCGFISGCQGIKRFSKINNILLRKILYPFWIIWMWPRVAVYVSKGDLVWANAIYAIPAVLPALIYSPHRVVLHLHEIEFPRFFLSVVRWAISRGARVLCVSDLHRQELNLAADVLHNCVNVHSDRAPEDPKIILFVGNLSNTKGFDLFVEVVRLIQPSTVRAIAFVPDVPYGKRNKVEAACRAGIEMRFGVSDPYVIYPGASLLLQCTDPVIATETFSLVMVEALACGVPVGTAGMKVAYEILSDACAFDVGSRNPEEIAACIKKLLASPERLNILISAAKKRREYFTYESFKANISNIIRNIEKNEPKNTH
jgi:glycosyltransferase involved in cell wall biosynthesis